MSVSRHFSRLCVSCATVVFMLCADSAVARPIPPTRAQQYFKEARAVSERDDGVLWGVKLYGPMLLVDPQTRSVVANEADREGKLHKQEGVFVGSLPAKINIANTATNWAGVHWTMIMWPLPEAQSNRARLMAHELWHRVQGKLALPGGNPANNHLDSRDGRIWLQLEWRALSAALRAEGSYRKRSVKDTLLFRTYRQSLFDNARDEERLLEFNEGLAEYTGVVLAANSTGEAVDRAVTGLRLAPQRPTFVRSFAYATGPALGLLLDAASPSWRRGLSVSADFGQLLQQAYAIESPDNLESNARARAAEYDFDSLHSAEAKRDQQRQHRLAAYRDRFIDGPTLRIPLRQMNIQFNPQNLVPLDDAGTVYPTLRVTDVWGILTVTDGALLSKDWTSVVVTASYTTVERRLEGEGWTLELEDHWFVFPRGQFGNFELVAIAP